MNDAANQVALITGGGTGVGRAVVLQLAARGWSIGVNYSRSQADAEATAAAAREHGVEAITLQGDVSKDADARRLVETCVAKFGRLTALVNNAGMTYFVEHQKLEDMTEQMWDRILDVNVKGAFFVSRAAIAAMQESGGGAIVNVSSIAGICGAGSSIAYAASKGAMTTMTKSLARAFAPDIRVNAVCPGVILTRWLEDHQDMIDGALDATPMKRASTAEDVADAVTFLLCDAKMMTGQAVVVDGGLIM